MKATALFFSLLAVGSLVAAEVEGNNTAVVIQKDPVASATHYQFVCVPVDGLDITGGSEVQVALVDLLPAASYPAGSVVYLPSDSGVIEEGSTAYYLLTDNSTAGRSWYIGTSSTEATTSSTAANSTNSLLAGGTVLWVYAETEDGSSLSTTVFCGEDRTGTTVVRSEMSTGTSQLKNDSSETKAISELVTGGFQTRDEVLRLKSGTNNYQHFMYNKTADVWISQGSTYTSAQLTIPAGEAFYFVVR